jgi:hypothetical protein
MNPGKHKKGRIQEWLEGEGSLVPRHSQSTHLLAASIKLRRPVARTFRSYLPDRAVPGPEAAPLKTAVRHSQAASWEHLQRLQRLAPLRAPFPYKHKQYSPKVAVAHLRTLTSSAPRRRSRQGSPFRN